VIYEYNIQVVVFWIVTLYTDVVAF